MPVPCLVRPVTDAAEWEAFFAQVEDPHMVQSWAYGEAKQGAVGLRTRRVVADAGGWRVRRLVVERGGECVAICQLLDKCIAGIRCASRVNRGPLFLGPDPQPEVVTDVYRALRTRAARLRCVLLVAPALPAGPDYCAMLAEAGYRPRQKRGWRSARLDLRPDEEELRRNLKPTWRNRLRAAERSGLQIKISRSDDDLRWMIERHADAMREKDFAGPSTALVRALCHVAPDDVLVYQAIRDEEPLGGMLVYLFGGGAEYYVGWMGQDGRKVNVGNFLYWQIALDLRRRGRPWFDLGGTNRDDTTGRFKQGMRGADYELLNEWVGV